MKRLLTIAIFSLSLTLMIVGCTNNGSTTDYSNLNQEEKQLLSIQDETTAKIEQLNSELQKENPDYDQIRFLAIETSKFINEKMDEVEKLTDDIKNSKIVEETEKILQSAQLLVNKIKELASSLQSLQHDISQLANDARAEIEQKIQETQTLLEGYKKRLAGMKEKFNKLRENLFNSSSDDQPTEETTESEMQAESDQTPVVEVKLGTE